MHSKQLTIVLAAAVTLLSPAFAHADWLVTRDGQRIETQGPWKVQGKLLVFTNAQGQLSSLRASEVDLEASEAATRTAEAPEQPAPEATTTKPRRAPMVITDADIAPSTGPAAGGAEGLAERLRLALQRKDPVAAMDLVRWEGAPPRARTLMQSLFDDAIQRPVVNVRIVPVGENDDTEYEIEGVTYRPNVEVSGKMLIDLGPKEDGSPNDTSQVSFLIGRALGTYYISSAVAVDDSDE